MKKVDPPKKVTIKDIAREAGVSVGAVSLILNDRPCRMSEQSKQRVKEIARQRNYVANQMARALVTRKSNTLGLILPDIGNNFFSALAQQLEKHCRDLGYYLMFANSDDSLSNERELIESFGSKGVDGLFLIQSNESYLHPEAFQETLGQLQIPYVMVDRSLPEVACDKVCFDNMQGGRAAASHLLAAGHRDVACVYMDDRLGNGAHRLRGFLAAMEEAGIALPPNRLIAGDNRSQSGFDAVDKVLSTGATAVFICNDMMTLGFLRGLHRRGRRVPWDLSVVSYDDSLQEYLFEVRLTTVAQDLDLLARHAAQVMDRRLRNADSPFQQIYLNPALICRESVAKRL